MPKLQSLTYWLDLLIDNYEKSVMASRGRITEQCEDIGYAMEYLSCRYSESIGISALDRVDQAIEIVKSCDLIRGYGVYYLFPLYCTKFALTGDLSHMRLPLINLSCGNRGIRDFITNCVYFVINKIPFNNPWLIEAVEDNCRCGHLFMEKGLYLVHTANGDLKDKTAMFQKWYIQDDLIQRVKGIIEPFVQGHGISNPFAEELVFMMNKLLDTIVISVQDANAQLEIDFENDDV